MKNFGDFAYMPEIPAENAERVQELLLQSYASADFADPTQYANPDDERMIDAQRDRLLQYPERYFGYQDKSGLLVAIAKSNEFYRYDEKPFAVDNVAIEGLRDVASKFRGGSLHPREYSAFDIISDDSLLDDTRHGIHKNLLSETVSRGKLLGAAAINFVTHEGDPALEAARKLYFEPAGSVPKTASTPRLERFRRPTHLPSFSNL